jgi:hypothetical protein
MLNQPMIEKLLAMRLHGMVEALKAQEQDRAVHELSFLERLALSARCCLVARTSPGPRRW